MTSLLGAASPGAAGTTTVTLVTAAQAFLTLRRLDPKAHTPV
jgi:hypothetical protein